MALSDPCRELFILENEERTSVVADEIAARLRILGRLISTIKFSPGSPIRTVTREVPTYEERSRDLKEKEQKTNSNNIPPLAFKNFPDKEYTPDDLYVYIERKESHLLRENGGTEAIAHALKTDLRRGIDTNSLEWRVKKFGTNSLPPAEENSFWGHIKEALGDTMMIILICAAFTSLILNLIPSKDGHDHGQTGWIEGAAILCSVVVVVMVTATNNYQKEKKFQQLSEETAKKESHVIRDGIRVTLDSTEIVVGDVLLVNGGDVLPADGLYIDGVDLKCDESTATGETDQMTKDPVKDPFFLSGTSLIEGAGRILVIGVGESSFSGRQAMLTREPPKPTPLQEKLSELADDIGFYGGLAAGLTLIVLSAKQFYFIYNGEADAWDIKPFLNFVIVAITIVVVAIPEGLPLAVTIALAYSMRNMMADNCLVRIMAACETMGGATAVCSDKTGTLTTNNMTVVQAWVAERRIIVPGTGIPCPKKRIQNNIENCHRCEGEVAVIQCEDCRKSAFCQNCFGEIHKGTWANHERREIKLQKSNLLDGLDDSAIDLFATALTLNCTAEEKLIEDGSSQWIGNKTEIGMLRFLKEKVEKDPREIKLSVSEQDIKQFPFNSDKKMMTTVVKSRGRGSKLLVKGAPDFLLPRCSQYLASDGKPKPMTKDKQNYLKAVITDMALLGNRTILVGMSERDSNSFPHEEPEDSLICVAILGIQDPIRSEVPEAISICQKAGIVVRMVTGDNKQTAVSIAEKAGIYHKDYGIVMEGKEFRQMAEEDPEKLRVNILPKLEVLARSSPKDKYVLVDLLRKQDQVTAVTGDGTNDAPALKLADVGFAMKSGTDIAKLASDIILLDDNFVSVVKACMWGRNVNDNIRKFLQFQVTVNVVGVLLTFIGATASEHNVTPLNPVQLLWLNLIMDTLAALALATEQPSLELLDRAPLHKSGGLISPRMWVNIIGHAIFQLCIMLTMMFYGIDYLVKVDEGVEKEHVHSTVIFNTFIFIQIWNEFNARKLHGEFNVFHGLMRSKGHLWVTLVMVAFQVFAIEVLGTFFGTVHLTLEQWGVCIGIGALCIPWAWVLHFVPAKEQKVENRFNQKERQKMQAAGRDMVNRIRVAKAFSQIRHPRRRSSLAELSPLGSKEAPFSTTRRILT